MLEKNELILLKNEVGFLKIELSRIERRVAECLEYVAAKDDVDLFCSPDAVLSLGDIIDNTRVVADALGIKDDRAKIARALRNFGYVSKTRYNKQSKTTERVWIRKYDVGA